MFFCLAFLTFQLNLSAFTSTFVTMKQIIILIRVIAALVLITLGVDKISEPSNWAVALGVAGVILGIALVLKPIISFFKKI